MALVTERVIRERNLAGIRRGDRPIISEESLLEHTIDLGTRSTRARVTERAIINRAISLPVSLN